jgi:hypothetical protein
MQFKGWHHSLYICHKLEKSFSQRYNDFGWSFFFWSLWDIEVQIHVNLLFFWLEGFPWPFELSFRLSLEMASCCFDLGLICCLWGYQMMLVGLSRGPCCNSISLCNTKGSVSVRVSTLQLNRKFRSLRMSRTVSTGCARWEWSIICSCSCDPYYWGSKGFYPSLLFLVECLSCLRVVWCCWCGCLGDCRLDSSTS